MAYEIYAFRFEFIDAEYVRHDISMTIKAFRVPAASRKHDA